MMWREATRVVAAEWHKLRRSRSTFVGLLLYAVLVVILYITFEIAADRSFIGILSGFYVAGATVSAAITPLAFVALLLGTFSIAREFSQGTIYSVWTRPLTRGGWLLGKVLAVAGHISVYFFVTALIVLLASGLRLGFSDLMEKDYLIYSLGSLWWRLVLSLALVWLSVVVVSILAVIPALYVGSPGGALTIALGIGFVMQIAGDLESLQPLLITSYLSMPLEQFVAMSKGVPVPDEWGTLIRTCMIGTSAWAVLGGLWARWVVYRKEVL